MPAARLLPHIAVNEIAHGSERAVARALLASLGDGWTVFHSYSWLRPTRSHKSTPLREGEADFVLIHPQHGLLIVEVKGGDVQYLPEEGLWKQNGSLLRDPFNQARRNMHALVGQVRERATFITAAGPDELPCSVGYAVVFPDCIHDGTLPQGAHPAILADASDLPTLGARMVEALKSWSGGKSAPLPAKDVHELHRALQGTFRLAPSLSYRLAQEEERLVQLTEQQAEALTGLYSNRRVLVEGVAGSGKTILAVRRALAFAEEGQSALLVCFNRHLAEHLNRLVQHENLTIRHFHGLCYDLCMAAHGEFKVPSPDAGRETAARFWIEEAPQQMFLAVDDLPDRQFDAIVVDEAQDFHNSWWDPVEALLREPLGPLYIFFDRAQNLYRGELQFPQTQARFDLRLNCRNTRKIATACGNVLGTEVKVSAFSPEGARPNLHRLSGEKAIREGCAAILVNLVDNEKVDPSRVAILSPLARLNSSLKAGLAKPRLTEKHEEWQAGKGVLFSTIRSFKGLESDVLLLIDLTGFKEGRFDRSDLYVAASRARHRLVVMTDSDEIIQALGVG